MARSAAANILRYVKSAPLAEVKVTLELARDEYKSRVDGTATAPTAVKKRRSRKSAAAATQQAGATAA